MTQLARMRCKRSMLFSLILLFGLVPAGGCSGIVERSWSEEVALDDGRVINIERYVKFRETNSLAGDAYNATDLKSTLSFKGEFKQLAVWSVPLVPILLYYDAGPGQWVIVATAGSCEAWYARGSPKPPYWEFRLRSGEWNQVSLSAMSMDRPSNLFFLYERSSPERALGLASKRKIIATNDIAAMYLSVIANVTWGCTAPVTE